jgi:hypothetical protein
MATTGKPRRKPDHYTARPWRVSRCWSRCAVALCVSGTDDSAESFEAAHRPQTGLESPVIGFDRIIGVLLDDMARRGQQFVKHSEGRRALGR